MKAAQTEHTPSACNPTHTRYQTFGYPPMGVLRAVYAVFFTPQVTFETFKLSACPPVQGCSPVPMEPQFTCTFVTPSDGNRLTPHASGMMDLWCHKPASG